MSESGEATASAGTAERLLAAAMEAFNTDGFGGTDSNRIARRAGFAPQTFYRRFADKTAIFVAVYERWEQTEMATLEHGVKSGETSRVLAAAIVEHHRATRGFRRSLRQLAVENDTVRAARAASRQRQIARIREWTGAADADAIAIRLLQIERLSDAVAEEELADLGVPETAAVAALAALLDGFRTTARHPS